MIEISLRILLCVGLFSGLSWWMSRKIGLHLKAEREGRRSPFKHPMLRPPGETLREEIDELRSQILDLAIPIFLWCTFPPAACLIFTQSSWLVFLIFFLPLSLLAFFMVRRRTSEFTKLRRQLSNKRLGFHGERFVAAELEPLREQGYQIFHDFLLNQKPGKSCNIDHIVVGPAGLFAIETKAWSHKEMGPDVKDHVIRYDRESETLSFPAGPSVKKPIQQIKAASRDLKTWLNSGKNDYQIQPVLVFPGWTIKHPKWYTLEVQSAKGLAKRLLDIAPANFALNQNEIETIAQRLRDQNQLFIGKDLNFEN